MIYFLLAFIILPLLLLEATLIYGILLLKNLLSKEYIFEEEEEEPTGDSATILDLGQPRRRIRGDDFVDEDEVDDIDRELAARQ